MSEPRTLAQETVVVDREPEVAAPSYLDMPLPGEGGRPADDGALPSDIAEVAARDPVWEVLVRCKGIVVGADRALDYYVEQLQRQWRERELLMDMRLLGERTSEIVGPKRSGLTG